MLRPDLIRHKCALISEDLQRLAAFRDDTLEQLQQDFIRMAAVERLLERIVMRAIDINLHLVSESADRIEQNAADFSYRESFLALGRMSVLPAQLSENLAHSAGLRNILVHDYNDVDRKILHAAIRTCLRDYAEYVGQIEAFLSQGDG